jgi:hypothetical protein
MRRQLRLGEEKRGQRVVRFGMMLIEGASVILVEIAQADVIGLVVHMIEHSLFQAGSFT